MSATNPVIFTPIDESEVSLSRPAQEDLIRKIYQNINMLGELAVIGAIEAFNINQSGAGTPNSEIFQLADGGEITNVDSPLRSQSPTTRNTPDTRDRYIRGANGSTTSGNELGGTATLNLQHAHSPTGNVTYPAVGTAGTDAYGINLTHNHIVSNDLSAAEPLEVAYLKVAFFLKIN